MVALDAHRGYANAVGVHLGHATLVVDHFHIIQLANRVIDDVRRRVQQHTTGHRGRAGDPLYGVRKLLLKACEDLDTSGWHRLARALERGDPDGEVAAAWQLKELTRDLYRASTVAGAREALEVFYAWAHSGDVSEMRRFARTVREHKVRIYAAVAHGLSNARVESLIIWSPESAVFDVADAA